MPVIKENSWKFRISGGEMRLNPRDRSFLSPRTIARDIAAHLFQRRCAIVLTWIFTWPRRIDVCSLISAARRSNSRLDDTIE